jgi:hypothetical protein
MDENQKRRASNVSGIIFVIAAVALAAYFFWPESSPQPMAVYVVPVRSGEPSTHVEITDSLINLGLLVENTAPRSAPRPAPRAAPRASPRPPTTTVNMRMRQMYQNAVRWSKNPEAWLRGAKGHIEVPPAPPGASETEQHIARISGVLAGYATKLNAAVKLAKKEDVCNEDGSRLSEPACEAAMKPVIRTLLAVGVFLRYELDKAVLPVLRSLNREVTLTDAEAEAAFAFIAPYVSSSQSYAKDRVGLLSLAKDTMDSLKQKYPSLAPMGPTEIMAAILGAMAKSGPFFNLVVGCAAALVRAALDKDYVDRAFAKGEPLFVASQVISGVVLGFAHDASDDWAAAITKWNWGSLKSMLAPPAAPRKPAMSGTASRPLNGKRKSRSGRVRTK